MDYSSDGGRNQFTFGKHPLVFLTKVLATATVLLRSNRTFQETARRLPIRIVDAIGSRNLHALSLVLSKKDT